MIDVETGGAFVTFEGLDGKPQKLKKLSPADILYVAELLFSERRELLRKNLAENVDDRKEQFAKLNEFDARGMTRAELIGEATDNPAVQLAMLRRAIVRTCGVVSFLPEPNAKASQIDMDMVDERVDNLEIDQNQIHTICLGLLHVTLKKESAPTTPEASAQTGVSARGSETTLENSTRMPDASAAP